MALDGIVLSNIVSDFQKKLIGGRILKIYQTERDEIIIGVRSQGKNFKLLLTAHSNYPRIHFTMKDKDNPPSPPMFCMLLRKHIGGGRITNIIQPNFERILEIHIESSNELGDLTTKKLIIEIMGRHSNIMLLGDDQIVIDSIKHIGKMQSSVRQIYPGQTYVYPPSQDKLNPIFRTYIEFLNSFEIPKPLKIQKRLYTLYAGMSPLIANEICYQANIDSSTLTCNITNNQKQIIYDVLDSFYNKIAKTEYSPTVYQDMDGQILAFSSVKLQSFSMTKEISFNSISELLDDFYYDQSEASRVSQKTSDLRKMLQIHHERTIRKKEIQLKSLEEVKLRDQYKIWGELLTANSHSIQPNTNAFIAINYYDPNMSEIKIPLDPKKNAIQNAQDYFKIYNKAKRTEIAANAQLKLIDQDLLYLDSLFSTLETLETETDIEEFRRELFESGYLKSRPIEKQNKIKKPKPLHFISDDGFDIHVGKNNIQNDHLTLKTANNHDLWFHTKDIPGSHVIIITGRRQVPENTIIQAAHLAAYYSKAKTSSNVPVDYTLRKNVKKPNGAKPGMVIYDNNKTIYVTPEKRIIDTIKIQ